MESFNVEVDGLAHDTRTVSMCIKTARNIQNDPPLEREIYINRSSIDLMLTRSWDVFDTRESEGLRYKFNFTVIVRPETREFFPGETKDYLRFDVSARGDLDPIPPGVRPQVLFANSWLDRNSRDAGAWLRVGPLDAANNLYLDFYAQFAP